MKNIILFLSFFFLSLSIFGQNSEEDERYQEIIQLLDIDSTETAFTLLDNFIEENPNHYKALKLRGEVYYDYGYYKNAMIDFQQLIKLDDQNDKIILLKAKCNYNLDNYAEALENIDATIKLDKTAYKLGLKGIILYKLNDYKNSLTALNEAISLEEDNSFFYLNKGKTLDQLDNYEGAIKAYDLAIQWDAKAIKAYNLKANLLYDNKNYEEALKTVNIAITIDSTSVFSRNIRGDIKRVFQDYLGAIKDYEIAISEYPNAYYSFMAKGEAYSKLNELDSAIIAYDRALEINPEYSYAMVRKGITLSDYKEYDAAFESFQQAIKVDPTYGFAHFRLGLLQKDEYAEKSFTEAIKYNPNYYPIYYERSFRRTNLGNYQGAINDLLKVIVLNPSYSAKAYYYIGDIYYQDKNYANALKYYQKSEDISPELLVEFSLGLVYSAMNDYDKEREMYKKLLLSEKEVPEPNGFLWKTVYNNIAYSYIKEDNLKSAKKYLKVALENAGNESYIYGTNGIYLYKKGNYKAALSSFNKAIEIYHNNESLVKNLSPNITYYFRGLTQYKLGNKKQGCNDLSKSGEMGYMKAYEAIKEYCNLSK